MLPRVVFFSAEMGLFGCKSFFSIQGHGRVVLSRIIETQSSVDGDIHRLTRDFEDTGYDATSLADHACIAYDTVWSLVEEFQ